jgi:hypothetical protein
MRGKNDDEKNNIKCSLEGLTPQKKKERNSQENRCDVKLYALLKLKKLKQEKNERDEKLEEKTPQGVDGKKKSFRSNIIIFAPLTHHRARFFPFRLSRQHFLNPQSKFSIAYN